MKVASVPLPVPSAGRHRRKGNQWEQDEGPISSPSGDTGIQYDGAQGALGVQKEVSSLVVWRVLPVQLATDLPWKPRGWRVSVVLRGVLHFAKVCGLGLFRFVQPFVNGLL